MFHAAKGLVTPRYTSALLLILVFASMIIAGCARNGSDSTSESASVSVPTAGTADQETAQEQVTDPPLAETAPVLRDGRWYAPSQHPDSQHPYGFFEKEAKHPCILVTPHGTVWLSENTPVNEWLASDDEHKLINGWIVSPRHFKSQSDEAFASTVERANQHEVEFVLSPVADDSPEATVATLFGLDSGRRYYKLELRPSAFQRGVGIKREVAEEPLKPGCAASLGEEVIAYQFQLSTNLGGDYREGVESTKSVVGGEAAKTDKDQDTPGVTSIGSWTVFDASSYLGKSVARGGKELLFLARTDNTDASSRSTREGMTIACLRPAGGEWNLSVSAHYDGDVEVSIDDGPVERLEHPWDLPEPAQFSPHSIKLLLPRLSTAQRVRLEGNRVSPSSLSKGQGPLSVAEFDVTGFDEVLSRFIAECPAPEAQALTQAARTHSTTAQKDTSANFVPAAFHGTWAANLDACAAAAEVGSPPEPGAVISADRIDRYEHYCEVTGVRAKTSDMLVADVQCAQEGETVQSSVTLIRIGDKLRLDGGGDYVSCYTPSRPLDQTQTQGATPDAIPFERLFYCANVAGRAVAFARSDKSNAAFAHNTIEVAMSTGRAYARYADDHATEIGGLSDERQAAIKREVSTMALEPALNGLMDCAQEPLIRRYLN